MSGKRKWTAAGIALLGAAAIAGCGSEGDATTAVEEPRTVDEITVDTGPFESDDEFLAAAEQLCSDYGEVFAAAPLYGVNAPGIEQELRRRVEIDAALQDDIESMQPTEGTSESWQALVDASADIEAGEKDVLAIAAKGDVEEANALLTGRVGDTYTAYGDAAADLGACEADVLYDQPPAEATAAAADGEQPSNGIEEAAADYLAALQSGDCARIAKANHSQNYAEPAEDCSSLAKSEKDSEVLATAQFGPVGAAYIGTDQANAYIQFVLDPANGELRYTTTLFGSDNGLRPPNDGIDADETAAATVDAIRENDADALNATLSVDQPPEGNSFQQDGPFDVLGTDPEYGKRIVSDVRDSPDAEPELIGADNMEAYYRLTTDGGDYVLVMRHEPGSETHYSLGGYWGLTE